MHPRVNPAGTDQAGHTSTYRYLLDFAAQDVLDSLLLSSTLPTRDYQVFCSFKKPGDAEGIVEVTEVFARERGCVARKGTIF